MIDFAPILSKKEVSSIATIECKDKIICKLAYPKGYSTYKDGSSYEKKVLEWAHKALKKAIVSEHVTADQAKNSQPKSPRVRAKESYLRQGVLL